MKNTLIVAFIFCAVHVSGSPPIELTFPTLTYGSAAPGSLIRSPALVSKQADPNWIGVLSPSEQKPTPSQFDAKTGIITPNTDVDYTLTVKVADPTIDSESLIAVKNGALPREKQ